MAAPFVPGNGTFTRVKVNGTASLPDSGEANSNCGSLRPMPQLLGGEHWSCVHTGGAASSVLAACLDLRACMHVPMSAGWGTLVVRTRSFAHLTLSACMHVPAA
jgi:hypothetical protein